jgi:hypothetical protein
MTGHLLRKGMLSSTPTHHWPGDERLEHLTFPGEVIQLSTLIKVMPLFSFKVLWLVSSRFKTVWEVDLGGVRLLWLIYW